MAMISSQELLRRQALFQSLPDHLLTRLAMLTDKVSLRRNEVFIQQNRSLTHIYILLNGSARMVRFNNNGRHVVIGRVAAGEPIGETHLFDQLPLSISALSERACDALRIPCAAIHEILRDHSAMTHYLTRLMSHRLRMAFDQVASLGLHGVVSRVAHKLVEMSVINPEGIRVTPCKVSRQDLAYQVGASREMVSRSLKDLHEEGAIEILPDGKLVLQEPLKRYCE
ncbi:MAG: hypothetical protein RLZZ397_674 [Pseudomonadota bacterium]|jgi:CRP/FNR family cyclic AMP-dependent transcriptional regulator